MSELSLDAIAADLARRAEAFECFGAEHRHTAVQFEAGRVKVAQTSRLGGVGLRVVVGGRLAVGGTADLAALDRTIDSTIESAAFGDRCEFAFAPPAEAAPLDVFDPAVPELPVAELTRVGQQVVDRLADLAEHATVSVEVGAGGDRRRFVNSAGQRFDCSISHYELSAGLECFGADDIFSVWESRESCRAALDVDSLVAAVRDRFAKARRVVPAGGPGQPVIFAPRAVAGLLTPLLAALNGQHVAEGVSPLADKRGRPRILDPKLTLIDDGTLPNRPASQPFDDEGVPTGRTVLIDAGRVENFLLDLDTAARLGLASTGNAVRDVDSPPSPGQTNLLLLPGGPGAPTLAEMIGQLEDGLLIDSLLGVGQGNVLAGDYSNAVGLGFKIRGGEVVGRVKGLSIAGNVYADLKQVAAVEDRGHWHGSKCLPHLCLTGLSVATGA